MTLKQGQVPLATFLKIYVELADEQNWNNKTKIQKLASKLASSHLVQSLRLLVSIHEEWDFKKCCKHILELEESLAKAEPVNVIHFQNHFPLYPILILKATNNWVDNPYLHSSNNLLVLLVWPLRLVLQSPFIPSAAIIMVGIEINNTVRRQRTNFIIGMPEVILLIITLQQRGSHLNRLEMLLLRKVVNG
jgi:hypothetical protein